jgi:hypothetical protein
MLLSNKEATNSEIDNCIAIAISRLQKFLDTKLPQIEKLLDAKITSYPDINKVGGAL